MKYSKLIIFTLIAVVITDMINYINIMDNLPGSAYLTTFLNYCSIIIFFIIAFKAKIKSEIPKFILYLFKLWLFWSIFSIVRGAFLARNYWDWRFLLLYALSFSLIGLVFYVGSNLFYTQKIIRFVLKYLFLFGFIFIPLTFLTNEELYSRLMIPTSLFILFVPYMKLKWKILIITVSIISILIFVGFRSNIIKIIFSVMLLIIYYFWSFINMKLIKFGHVFLFFLPILFFILAIYGKYNLFNEIAKNDETTVSLNNQKEENLVADTRTFLYVEVLATLYKSGNWLLGESPSRGYKSLFFYNTGGAMNGVRYRSEVNILNILLYNGLVGVIIYFFLLYRVSYLAITKSNNILSKLLGLFIAFRWSLSFVEEFTQYDLNFYFFWLVLGLISTSSFRNMDDDEIKNYLYVK